MLRADEMPEDNADLARLEVSLPRLPDDSPHSCPVSIVDLVAYLTDEVPGGERLTEDDLAFLRTADVEGTQYWVWRFDEPEGDEAAYATVSVDPAGNKTIGYDADYYSLTPEQFIVGDYHQVF